MSKIKTEGPGYIPGSFTKNAKEEERMKDKCRSSNLETFDDLLKKDHQREKDGFPKKIKIGRVGGQGSSKIILVPMVEEEKLIHVDPNPLFESGGQGQGEEGDVIGEKSLEEEGEGEDQSQAGEEGSDDHGIEAEVYEVAKELIEDLDLPNLQDKGKKVPTTEYVYDLTDRHRGSGQILDKKATIKNVLKTNLVLGTIDPDNPETSGLVISPRDKVYRLLSRERVWKSMAVVFFMRDYSGSMSGRPSEVIVQQHLMIYAWLMREFQELVLPRFILHDAEAKEVNGFNEYFRSRTAGGTIIASGFKLINKIVKEEGLERDYNLYVFYGTDGDDWDNEGKESIPAIKECLDYVNRLGATIIGRKETIFEKVIASAKFAEERPVKFRLDILKEDVELKRIGEGIKKLVSP